MSTTTVPLGAPLSMDLERAATTGRRAFLRLSGTAAAATLACSRAPLTANALVDRRVTTAGRDAGRKVLLVFFSRAGENYFHGGRKFLSVGNTEVVAGVIRKALGCDVFQIRALDPYSDRYDPTVERNVREQNQNARPGIMNLMSSIAPYDTVLIGSPIWNVRVPRIMLTFADQFDFAGKVVCPFTTHAMSGLGHAVDEYRAACRGATVGEALAVRGEQADGSGPMVEAWLRKMKLLA